jgi:hypothetical protein
MPGRASQARETLPDLGVSRVLTHS